MHERMFLRWRCLTHGCGSYNFNQLIRHEIHSCEIIREQTVGVVKPKSFGGYKGDLGRGHIKEYQEEVRQQQIDDGRLAQWLAYRAKKIREIYRYRRNANPYQTIRFNSRKKNQKR